MKIYLKFIIIILIEIINAIHSNEFDIYYIDNSTTSLIIDCTVNKTSAIQQQQHLLTTTKISWQKDKIELDLINDNKRELLSNGSLKLNLIDKYSFGLYKCIIIDSFGKLINKIAIVEPYFFGKNLIKEPENKTVEINKSVLLNCKPNATQTNKIKLTYEWYKDNQLIKIDNKRNILNIDGSLEINKLNENDNGYYKCIVRYRTHKLISKSALLNVITTNGVGGKRPPNGGFVFQQSTIFQTYPQDTISNEYDDVLFECSTYAAYQSFVTYKWLKDGVSIENTRDSPTRVFVSQGSNLKILNLNENDAGSYTCRICQDTGSNDDGHCDERSALLTVYTSPRFVKRPKSKNSTIRSDVDFECEAYGIPEPTIKWYKNGERIDASEYFQYINDTNLRILGIIKQDEGYYQCMASNQLNSITGTAQLQVIDRDERDVNNPDNNNYSDSYDTDNDDTEADEFGLDDQEMNDYPTSSSSSSHFLISNDEISEPFDLKASKIESRKIELTWKSSKIVSNRNSEIFYTIKWKPKDDIDKREREMNTTQLSVTLDDLIPSTIYIIRATASYKLSDNKIIRSKTNTQVEVRTLNEDKIPSAPYDFQISIVNAQTIKLKWKMNKIDALAIIKYRLYYKQTLLLLLNDKSPQNANSENLNENSEEMDENSSLSERYLDILNEHLLSEDMSPNEKLFDFVLEDLNKYSRYVFKLAAIDTHNRLGLLSDKVSIHTPSDVPDGPPQSVSVETMNTTAIRVSWQPPLISKCNGIVIGYKISLKETDKQMTTTFNVDSEPRMRVFNALQPGKKYSIRINARTINGTGPFSEWLFAQTYLHDMDESKVPDQPIDLFADPTDTSIVVHWMPPKDSNRTIVRKYLLKYGVFIPDQSIVIDANRDSYIISDLTPSSQYILSLRAGNNMGWGREILKEVLTKRKSALSDTEYLFPPLNVQAKSISQQAIELSWTDWHLKSDEEIPDDRYYVVRYDIAENMSPKYKYKNSSERSTTITGLKPNTLYDFAVKLVVGNRETDWSMTTSQMTMETIQAFAPRNVQFEADVNRNHDKKYANVIISWEVPIVAYSNYQQQTNDVYIISYADEASFKENKWKQNHISKQSAINAANNDNMNSNNIDESSLNPQQLIKMQAQIRKLKLNTIYYFKIQERNNREYVSESEIVLFKTPDINGNGGTVLLSDRQSTSSPKQSKNFVSYVTSKYNIEMNLVWIITSSVVGLIVVFLLFLTFFLCKRSSKQRMKNTAMSTGTMKSNNQANIDCLNEMQSQNQKLLNINTNSSCNNSANSASVSTNNGGLWLCPSVQTNTSSINGAATNSNLSALSEQLYGASQTSTIKRQQMQQLQQQRNNSILTSSSIGVSPTHDEDNDVLCHELRPLTNDSNVNEFMLLQHANALQSDTNSILSSNTANMNMMCSANELNSFENAFVRHQSMRQQKPIPFSMNSVEQSFHTQRKSFKNLPVATATLIPSNVNNSNSIYVQQQQQQQVQQQQQPTKLQYTARPYMIDNQVLSDVDHHSPFSHHMNEYCNHSPCSSTGGSQPAMVVYDKIGNALNEMNAAKTFQQTRSLLQPLKSFGVASNTCNNGSNVNYQQPTMPMTQVNMSIPGTPRHSELASTNLFNIQPQITSPSKMLFTCPRNPPVLMTMPNNCDGNSYQYSNTGKPVDNIYERNKFHNSQELHAEMANLEGIMKDLSAITNAQQFEC